MKHRRPPYLWLSVLAALTLVWRLAGLWHLDREIDRALAIAPSVAGATTSRQVLTPLPPYPRLTKTPPRFAARQYAVLDIESNVVVLSEDAERAVPLASTTKIMTALLALERGSLSDVVEMPRPAALQIGSSAGLKPGEKLTVRSLLYGALLNSGNDAAYGLAYYLGSEQSARGGADPQDWDQALKEAVEAMNNKARDLNLDSFKFGDPSGLDSQNVASATDLARLAAIALRNPTFREMTSTPQIVVQDIEGQLSHEYRNSNRLVGEWQYPGAIGVKTGYTPEAGHNLVAACERDGHTLVVVVLNTHSNTNTASAQVARDILDFSWQAISWE